MTERLRALPNCVASESPPAVAETPSPGATEPPATDGAAPSGDATPRDAPETNHANRFVITFDERLPALTPHGIRAFDDAVAALHKGEDIQLAIEGCAAPDAKQPHSACARRLAALTELLRDRGVKSPKRLLAEYQ
jgi:hypothetical protein